MQVEGREREGAAESGTEYYSPSLHARRTAMLVNYQTAREKMSLLRHFEQCH